MDVAGTPILGNLQLVTSTLHLISDIDPAKLEVGKWRFTENGLGW